MSESGPKSNGMGLCSTIFVVFLILKLTEVVAWSWFWVCSPLIFGGILSLILIAGILGVMIAQDDETGIGSFVKEKCSSIQTMIRDKKRKRTSEKNLKWAEEARERAKDIKHRFKIMDIEVGGFKGKLNSQRPHIKPAHKIPKQRFSLKRWWVEGNKKAVEKKSTKKAEKKKEKT